MDSSNEKMVNSFRFEDLRVYNKALNYSQWVSENFKEVKTPVQTRLLEKFYVATMAISLNIAEGSSRTQKQFEHYLRIAKTAIRECIVYSSLTYNSGLFSEESYTESRQVLMELTKMVSALIISLQKSQARKSAYSYMNEGDSEAETAIEPEILSIDLD